MVNHESNITSEDVSSFLPPYLWRQEGMAVTMQIGFEGK